MSERALDIFEKKTRMEGSISSDDKITLTHLP